MTRQIRTVRAVCVAVLAAAALVPVGSQHSATAQAQAPVAASASMEAIVAVQEGASATQRAVRVAPPPSGFFPMQPTPKCQVLDNFGDPRSGGRTHEGVDILATLGQQVYAVADGTLTRQNLASGSNASLSGNAWTLTAAGGTFYFYAHLSAFAPGLSVGSHVTRGELIGYVGDTGNAGPGNYHLHFEVHPGGGAAVNPLPLLDLPSGCKVY